jgi:hypothetical protein
MVYLFNWCTSPSPIRKSPDQMLSPFLNFAGPSCLGSHRRRSPNLPSCTRRRRRDPRSASRRGTLARTTSPCIDPSERGNFACAAFRPKVSTFPSQKRSEKGRALHNLAGKESTPAISSKIFALLPPLSSHSSPPPMDQERTPPATKRTRCSPQQAGADAGEEDRLRALDDATLHAILVRLPLRDAAATVVLSRRWPRVFATLPRLVLRPATFNRRGFPDEGDEDRARTRHAGCAPSAASSTTAPGRSRLSRSTGDSWDCRFLGLPRALRERRAPGAQHRQHRLQRVLRAARRCVQLYTCTTLTSLDLYNCRL